MNEVSPRRPERATDPRDGGVRPGTMLARNTVAIVLAGGRGTRLHRLTEWRAEPPGALGGKIRIIDFTLSHRVEAGNPPIGICTQYPAPTPHSHVPRAEGLPQGALAE